MSVDSIARRPDWRKGRISQRTEFTMSRTTSDRSSTSSDILVASVPPPSPPRLQSAAPLINMTVSARRENGVVVISGVRELLLSFTETADHSNDGSDAQHPDREKDEFSTVNSNSNSNSNADSFIDASLDDDDDDGPNQRGTYSKAYTLRHPDIKWIHRGQGRYLPSSSIKQNNSASNSRKPHVEDVYDQDKKSTRLSTRARNSDASSIPHDADETPRRRQASSQLLTRSSDATYSLRRRPSELEPSVYELRATRMQRRARPSASSINDRRSPPVAAIDDGEYDSNKTYNKAYVEAHPDVQWRHCGNGFYKKVSKQNSFYDSSRSSRRDSSRSLAKSEVVMPDKDQKQRRYHSSELKHHPGIQFQHCGNGWYRRKFGTSPQPSTHDDASNDLFTSFHGSYDSWESPEDDTECEIESDIEFGGEFDIWTEEQMLRYKKANPEAMFEDRGNGRYKHNIDHLIRPDAGNKTTSSPGHVPQHPGEKLSYAGWGRRKRGPNPPKRFVLPNYENNRTEDGQELAPGLFTKQYVANHPWLSFHHRGQGRYALGPRPKNEQEGSVSIVEEETSKDVLFDTHYVDLHPDETFHHRGQGRWARGLPPPGSSNKMAIRGPVSQAVKPVSTPSPPETVNNGDDDPPGLYELVYKIDGPERWPQFHWNYRGGGKWCRSTKDEADRAKRDDSRYSKYRLRVTDDSAEGQMSRDAVASELESVASGSRRGSPYGLEPTRPSLKRKRSLLQIPDDDDSARQLTKQRSKTSSPRLLPLSLDEDVLGEEDFPELFHDNWSPLGPEEPSDAATEILRSSFLPLNAPNPFLKSLTKHDPTIRPTEVLEAITAHAQDALRRIQDEYLKLDKVTAPHARIARKPAKGGRIPAEHAVFEDRKEAELYDYTFDPRKIGYQDPEAQKIIRDAEGRELRKRRGRHAIDTDFIPAAAAAAVAAVVYPSTDDPPARRTVRPVSRFDGAAAPARKRRALGSVTPDPVATPEKLSAAAAQIWADGYVVPTTGRWAGHIPKRIRELRGESTGANKTEGGDSGLANGASTAKGDSSQVKKGRPRGSRNLYRRRDAGIAKGPRKPKVIASIEEYDSEEDELHSDIGEEMYL